MNGKSTKKDKTNPPKTYQIRVAWDRNRLPDKIESNHVLVKTNTEKEESVDSISIEGH